MSVGVFTPPVMMDNMTHTIFHGFGGSGGSNGGVFGNSGVSSGGHRPVVGKHCIDLHQRLIEHGVHFVPGPDQCTQCACDDGEPKWCKAVLCSPPQVRKKVLTILETPDWNVVKMYAIFPYIISFLQDCKSFRVGNSCCEFICLDDNTGNGGPNTGGPYLSRPVEIANFVPKVVIAAVTFMLSLSLLFFLIHRLRQRHIQGRGKENIHISATCYQKISKLN